jgi:hypothetical protein
MHGGEETTCRYLLCASSDYFELHKNLFRISRLPIPTARQKFSLGEDLHVNAFTLIDSDSEQYIECSLGTLLALDDLFLRLACNRDFFSFENAKIQWPGCDCYWLTDESNQPLNRYYDYSPSPQLSAQLEIGKLMSDMMRSMNAAAGVRSEFSVSGPSFLPRFYSGIPTDEERINLAKLMFEIGFLWIMLHEESHYDYGHLLFMKSRMQGKTASESRVDELKMNEAFSPFLSRVLEWQADRGATGGVVDVMLQKKYLKRLPSYCRKNKAWLLRLILASIGCVMLIFQKGRRHKGISGTHPSIPTRLISILIHTLERLNSSLHKSNLSLEPTELMTAWIGAVVDLTCAEGLLPAMQEFEPDGIGGKRPQRSKKSLGLWDSLSEVAIVSEALFRLGESVSPKTLLETFQGEYPEIKKPGATQTLYKKWFKEMVKIVNEINTNVHKDLSPYRKQAGGAISD